MAGSAWPLLILAVSSWVYSIGSPLYHSWFSLDGVNDLGDVTLVCDDEKPIRAHELVQLGWCE